MTPSSPSLPETGASTYFLPLLILFLVLSITSLLQIIGLEAMRERFNRTEAQVTPTLMQVVVVKNLSEHLFKDIIDLAPHNANAARIQSIYGIREHGVISAPTPSN